MELNKEDVKASDLLQPGEYLKLIGAPEGTSIESLRHNCGIKPGTPDKIDFVRIGTWKLIVKNEKSLSFRIGGNYNGSKPRKKAEVDVATPSGAMV